MHNDNFARHNKHRSGNYRQILEHIRSGQFGHRCRGLDHWVVDREHLADANESDEPSADLLVRNEEGSPDDHGDGFQFDEKFELLHRKPPVTGQNTRHHCFRLAQFENSVIEPNLRLSRGLVLSLELGRTLQNV